MTINKDLWMPQRYVGNEWVDMEDELVSFSEAQERLNKTGKGVRVRVVPQEAWDG